jgi:nucleoside-diphosphate kinase
MSKFTKPALADAFYEKHKGAPFFADLATYMQSDVVTGMELVAANAIETLRGVLGPTDSAQAKKEAPGSLRAAFGTDVMRNAVHASASSGDYQREHELFFSPQFGPTAAFNNCTCCIIKPHVIQDGLAGQVIDAILQEGFEISSMQMFTLDKPTAEEFFEVYKGVLPEFVGMIEAMTLGPCIVMEIR